MKSRFNTRRAAWLRAGWQPALIALSLGLASHAHAGPAVLEGVTRTAAVMEAPPTAGQEGGELVVMVCRRGLAPTPQATLQQQEVPQELPLLCLATVADEEAMQLGPARFHELLNKAAEAGLMHMLVIQRE